jgi:cytoskeletal protein RodZ
MSYPPGPYQPDPGYDPGDPSFNTHPTPGYPPAGPPPKKSRKGLIITLSVVGAVVLLLCCGGVAAFVVFNPLKPTTVTQQPQADSSQPSSESSSSASASSQPDSNTGGAASARDAADRYLTAVKNKDEKSASAVTCASLGQQPPPGMPAGLDPSTIQLKSFTYTISKDDATSGTHHDVTAPTKLSLSVAGEDYDASGTYKLGVDKQGSGWKACKVDFTVDGVG